jgi:tRNA-binding EMAP/Myf-like protein
MSSLIVEVCKVDSITKHPNADKLSVVGVKGWNCIVGLDQYKVGDLVVFIPPDSIIPEKLIEKYELAYLKHNGRVGTAKLRGYISQGLVLEVPAGKWKLGDNVADIMGITKWEPPQSAYSGGIKQTSKKKLNPDFDKYTEIENIKNFNGVFKDGDGVVITEKIHGCNARYGLLEISLGGNVPLISKISAWWKKNILKQKYEFVYGSHNVQITGHTSRMSFYGDDVWGTIGKRYDLKSKLLPGMIIYGEIYGEGIQDLTYGIKGTDFAVFDIKEDGKYMDWSRVEDYCEMLELKTVPVLYQGDFSEAILDESTGGESMLSPGQIREGCVVKPVGEENNPQIGRKVLKSINPEYLLRKNATEFK